MKEVNPFSAPNPNAAPQAYSPQYVNQFQNQNRLYFTQLDNVNRELLPAVHSLNVLYWISAN
ncbi:MAG: hypothetical protein ACO3V1_09845 [Candidatus Nanopelagicales bacterium]